MYGVGVGKCLEYASRKEVGVAPQVPLVSTVALQSYERVSSLGYFRILPGDGEGE